MNSTGAATPDLPPESLEPEAPAVPPPQDGRLPVFVSWRVVLIVLALLALSLIAGFGGPLVLSLLAQWGP